MYDIKVLSGEFLLYFILFLKTKSNRADNTRFKTACFAVVLISEVKIKKPRTARSEPPVRLERLLEWDFLMFENFGFTRIFFHKSVMGYPNTFGISLLKFIGLLILGGITKVFGMGCFEKKCNFFITLHLPSNRKIFKNCLLC